MGEHERFDYTAVGHVTIDVLADGSRRPGGSAFYSALQAARLGRRARILTRGVAREIEELLEPYREELELEVLPGAATTTLQTRGSGLARSQRLLAWAGPIPDGLTLDTAILHLAPIARETPTRWLGTSDLLALTPQGLVREWPADGGEIRMGPPPREALALACACDAIVLDGRERASCADMIERARESGALVVITAGAGPNTIIRAGASALELDVPAVEGPLDDLGAGDVFAAALFIALGEQRSPEQAAAFANAAAAVRLQGAGAAAVGGRSAIEARLAATAS